MSANLENIVAYEAAKKEYEKQLLKMQSSEPKSPWLKPVEEESKKLKKMIFDTDDECDKITGYYEGLTKVLKHLEDGDQGLAMDALDEINIPSNPKTDTERRLLSVKNILIVTAILAVVGAALFFSGGLAALPLVGYLFVSGPGIFAAATGATMGFAAFAGSAMTAGFASAAAASAYGFSAIGAMAASVNSLYLAAGAVTGAIGISTYAGYRYGKSKPAEGLVEKNLKNDESSGLSPATTTTTISTNPFDDKNDESNDLSQATTTTTKSNNPFDEENLNNDKDNYYPQDPPPPVPPKTKAPNKPPPPPPPRITVQTMDEQSLNKYKVVIEAGRSGSPTASNNENASLGNISPDSNNGPKNG